eukprot:TRINITY_DN1755_c0_g6_i1.p1 TRINITY_DN1755_c0_g6~~TRINITY_DN1755_c0_g6_i1.p1  ORF type:complete len:163 (-),score=46.56 TRINITY_DN1755_c0_g6_i1:568-1056(-)
MLSTKNFQKNQHKLPEFPIYSQWKWIHHLSCLKRMRVFLNGGEGMKFFQEMSASIPGIDEAMSFATVMKFVQNMKFSVVVFDTAPTGHTLRFLSFPSILEKGFAKLGSVKDRLSGLFSQVWGMVGGAAGAGVNEEQLSSQFESLKVVTQEINQQFKNPVTLL